MRLLFLIERYPPDAGVVARSGERTARALARLGAEVDVLAWTRALPPGQLETRRDPDLTVHRLGLFSGWDLSMQHTQNVLEWLNERSPYSAVFGHYLFPAGFVAVLFAESAGIASVVSARGNDLDRLMFPPGDFGRLLWALERATLRTAVSHDLARKIDLLLGRDAGTVVIPNAVDLAVFTPAPDLALRARIGVAEGELVLGFCGELRHKKGLPFLLTALAEVRAARPACLLVIGETRARERVQLVRFGVEDPATAARILETGHLESPKDVAAHLRACDLTLLPSVWDGLPNALLESMACGVPVIASDAGGMPEVIRHGVDGFLVPRAELHRLGTAVLEAMALSPERRGAIARAARARIEADYDGRAESAALARVLATLGESPKVRA